MKVLLVDDEAGIVEEMASFLRRRGHSVVGADGVASALAALDSQGPFDVVLTDWRMPGGSGLDVVRACRLRPRPRPTVVVISGHLDPSDSGDAYDAGAAHVITKPVSLRGLVHLLGDITTERTMCITADASARNPASAPPVGPSS